MPYPPPSRTDALFFLQITLQLVKQRKKAIKYLGRTVVPLTELPLGSTLEHVSSLVKSRRLVPCMWKSETRLHRSYSREEDNPSAAPCFHQQSQAMRACMTSVGMWGSAAHSWLVAMGVGGVPKEVRIVDLNNDRRDDSLLGYKFCQPIHCRYRKGELKVSHGSVGKCSFKLRGEHSIPVACVASTVCFLTSTCKTCQYFYSQFFHFFSFSEAQT